MNHIMGPDGRPMQGGPPQTQLNIKPHELDDVKCDKCGNHTFVSVALIKVVPSLVSPTGKEAFVPMQVFACNGCGHVNERFIEGLGGWFKGTTPPEEEKKEDGIVSSELPGLQVVDGGLSDEQSD